MTAPRLPILSLLETRVLGVLCEKQHTVPDTYPLSLNALVAGCNPTAWTGTNATPIATIAGAVSPAGILVALWQFEGGVWLGYSPEFPDVSDLTSMDRLDVVFVCVNAAGTFSRPII